MATSDAAPIGLTHLTVVPANFDPEAPDPPHGERESAGRTTGAAPGQ